MKKRSARRSECSKRIRLVGVVLATRSRPPRAAARELPLKFTFVHVIHLSISPTCVLLLLLLLLLLLVPLLVLRLVCVLPSRCIGRPRQHTEKSSYASLDLSRSAPHSVSLYLSPSAARGAARAAPIYPPRSRARCASRSRACLCGVPVTRVVKHTIRHPMRLAGAHY